MEFYYIVDGDDIGRRIEEYAFKNDLESIIKLSFMVRRSLDKIGEYFYGQGGEVLFCEGDSLLVRSERLIEISEDILSINGICFSVGVGNSIEKALFALKKAKGLGKKRIEIMEN